MYDRLNILYIIHYGYTYHTRITNTDILLYKDYTTDILYQG